ncbi:MAG TPA: site-2 protease family protein [Candidatus Aphodovivens avistercoris]|nr:site-2 protease family protein [Candidatus Aphodovivens avistercoris]
MLSYSLPSLICTVLAFVPALVLHEAAHGFAAWKLGDPTAKRQGRLSLNPARHIDPFGTVILPLCLFAMNMPVFGYAKPVSYNPAYFENPRKGEMVVGLAGPASNLLQAVVGAAVAAALWFALPMMQLAIDNVVVRYAYFVFLPTYVLTNLYLLFFNILPIPPLDGSSVLAYLLPKKHLRTYYKVQRYALPILLVALILLPYVLRINPVGWYLDVTAGNLYGLLYAWMV